MRTSFRTKSEPGGKPGAHYPCRAPGTCGTAPGITRTAGPHNAVIHGMIQPDSQKRVTIPLLDYMRVALPPLVGHLCIHSFDEETLILDLAGPENPDRIRARVALHDGWTLSNENRELASAADYLAEALGPQEKGERRSRWRQRVIIPYLARVSAIALGVELPDLRVNFQNGLVAHCPAGPDGSPMFTLRHWP